MYNSIILHDSQKFYEVTHQGKHYQCARVSDIIEQTSSTPRYLKQWMVNCGTEALINGFHINFPHEPYNTWMAQAKKIAWQAHQIKSQQALDVGTKVHHWIKSGAMDEAEACEESRACWDAYSQFTAKYVPCTIASEIALYDLKSFYAGTCDYIGTLRAVKAYSAQYSPIYIIDWKTSKAINETYKMQVTVYKHMIMVLLKEFKKYPSRFNESTTRILNTILLAAGKNPQIVCGIVRLSKRPSARKPFEFVTVTKKEEKAYLKEFLLMAKLHNLRQKGEN